MNMPFQQNLYFFLGKKEIKKDEGLYFNDKWNYRSLSPNCAMWH